VRFAASSRPSIIAAARSGPAIGGRLPLVLLAAALAVGAYLRFDHLAALELSADEGASWLAASGSTVSHVFEMQTRLNPGELGLHDVALHWWMDLFGDSLAAMRSLSASAGTIAILLVFMVAREVLAPTRRRDRKRKFCAITLLIASSTQSPQGTRRTSAAKSPSLWTPLGGPVGSPARTEAGKEGRGSPELDKRRSREQR